MTSGVENQLQVRLQKPPRCNARLVCDFDNRLVIAYRTTGAGEQNSVPVQTSSSVANSAIARGDAQQVEFPARQEALVGQAEIRLQIEEIAVGYRIANAQKGCEALSPRLGTTPQHFVQYR